jgi:hypothetical protein
MAHELTDMAQAASVLSKARRISVIGCPGGKTTLARWLSAFGLPFVPMDAEFFGLSGWISRPRAEQRAMIAAQIDEPQLIMYGSVEFRLKVCAVCRPHPALTYLE